MVVKDSTLTPRITIDRLAAIGVSADRAARLANELSGVNPCLSPAEQWQEISQSILDPQDPFDLHRTLFQTNYSTWDENKEGPPPAWIPTPSSIQRTNLFHRMSEWGFDSYEHFHRWSVDAPEKFWEKVIDTLGIRCEVPPAKIMELSNGIESPKWMFGARLNIAASCFQADAEATAIVERTENGDRRTVTYRQLDDLSGRVAASLLRSGLRPGDAWSILMPMTAESVVLYLGVVKAGGTVVSIADSFSPPEIERRFKLADTKGVFVQDIARRAGKEYPLYEKIARFDSPRAVVLECEETTRLRSGDSSWEDFLRNSEPIKPVSANPDDVTNILFSSGTTGEPKAIPWTHTTPIKCASDGYFHHDIQPGDVVAWPTNLGWMMGPWLIYATLVNRGTIALFDGAPATREFAEFVQDERVNMLGVVPTLVKTWRRMGLIEGLDWSSIKTFSSTGECSNPDDMLYLMSRAGYRPVIEYCGGTEIGGGYITSTLVQPNSPSVFTTPAMGLDFKILDSEGKVSPLGEVFIEPPSIGLSTRLLNRDHHVVYYEGCPSSENGKPLRRHGDEIERLPNGNYRAHGRSDDTMNLSGIKVSSAEIERILLQLDGVVEVAAIAASPPGGGPDELVVNCVLAPGEKCELRNLLAKMQERVKMELNPQFKIQDLVIVDSLPRTESNKVMRRRLRDQYRGTRAAGK